ncbi:MAG: alpha/beta fold hydrolase [Oligoflexales bacterium]
MHQQSEIFYHPELRLVEDRIGIHVVKTIVDETQPTLLYLPGLSNEAIEGFNSLAPCLEKGFNVASMSFRGRGQSSTPKMGYSMEDHAEDFALVVDTLKAKKLIVVATSISTLYAARHLVEDGGDKVAGMVIVDHPLHVKKLKQGWAEEFSKLTVNGVPVTKTMRRSAMDCVEKESEAYDLYFSFMELEIPTLVLYPTIPKGIIGENDIERFKHQGAKLVEFEDSNHFIRLRQPEKYCKEIMAFAESI